MKKSTKILLIALAAVLSAAMIATVSLSAMTLLKVSAMEKEKAAEEAASGNAGEDDVVIGGQYVIRSTKAISDAYLSADSSGLSEKDRETLDMASQVLAEVVTDGMSDYEKEQAVFLWMNGNIGGDSEVTVLVRDDITTDNPHGVLSSRNAVCVGYATTFRLFMQMLGIPCMVVHDVYLSHSWDLVQIGGHWYHTDLYSAQNSDEPLVYLNRPDALQSAFGSEWDVAFYPASDSFESCYLYRQAVKADDLYAIPAALKEAIDGDSSLLALTIPVGEHDAQVAEYLLSSLEMKLTGTVEYEDCLINRVNAMIDEKSMLVAFMIERYGYEDPDDFGDLSDDEIARADQAIEDSFGELTYYEYDDDWYAY